MSIIIDIVKGLFGLSEPSGPDYGPFNPSDFARYHQASYEITEADEDAAKLQQIYAKYGIKNENAWGRINQAFYEDNKANPDFHVCGITPRIQEQLDEMASSSYAFPSEYLEPVEGVTMEKLAAIVARREAAHSPTEQQTVLAHYGLDEASFGRIDQAWRARMGGSADAMAANILGGFWHTYITVARSAVQKAA